jgi:hypothetical protein
LLALTMLGVALSHCSKSDATATTADDSTVVDTQLLAFLSLARAHHHEATLLEDSGDTRGAIAALQKIIDAPKPHPGERVPEIEEVLADTFARMAELELGNKNTEAARRDVETGLTHVAEPTYFRGHLLEVYGIVEEARTKELADAGNAAEAERARTHALVLLREAVDVQESVIASVLDGGAREGGAR